MANASVKTCVFFPSVNVSARIVLIIATFALPRLGFSQPSCDDGAVAKEPDRFRRQAIEVTEDIHRKHWMPKVQRYSNKPGSNQADAVWGAGVMFSAIVGATRHEPAKFKPILGKFYDGLEGYWDKQSKLRAYEPTPRQNGNDKYYDDNAWMVIAFFEAYELTHTPTYRRRGEETLDFVLSGWVSS